MQKMPAKKPAKKPAKNVAAYIARLSPEQKAIAALPGWLAPPSRGGP